MDRCEQDSLSVCFWDKANAPPVLFLRLKSIGGVSAAPYLPDGCCFSVSVASEVGVLVCKLNSLHS